MKKTLGYVLEFIGCTLVLGITFGSLMSSSVDSALSPLFCSPSEHLQMGSTPGINHHNSISAYCVDGSGARRDVIFPFIILIVIVGIVPMVIGNWLVRSRKRYAFPMPGDGGY